MIDIQDFKATNNNACASTYAKQNVEVKRGDIWYADLGDRKEKSSVQAGRRPCIIIQNDIGNKYSPTVLILPCTSQVKRQLPTHTKLGEIQGLDKQTYVLAEQTMVINRHQLLSRVSNVNAEEMDQINKALMVEAGIDINSYVEKEIAKRLENDNKMETNYAIPQRSQNNAFDIFKTKKMVTGIESLETALLENTLGSETVTIILSEINTKFLELQYYCKQFRQDYKIFYKPKFNNQLNERRVKCV